MPIQTNLNVSPYYDDYSQEKDFYRILFKPGVAVQARELNQLQSILQKQIERFGDNIFTRGTIIDGCNIRFEVKLPYVKIKDVQIDGAPVNVEEFVGLTVRNSANLVARVEEVIGGYESRDPDLNTLFVKYQNSGSNNNTSSYANDQILTVYDPSNVIFKIVVNDGQVSFSNTDNIIVYSAVAVQNSSGGQTVSYGPTDIINNGVANAEIISVDTTTNTSVTILKIKPLSADLANTSPGAGAAAWTFANGDTITIGGPESATIVEIIGSGATGSLVTDAQGQIDYVTVTSQGSGYYIVPHVTVQTTTATAQNITDLDLEARTYLTQITVAPATTTPVGYGYGMVVSEGVIYQKGYFSRVSEQLVVVDKYSNTPDQLVVGFSTSESIINSNIDTSLLDNAFGSPNYTAPGADRLKLAPVLVVQDKTVADADPDFFAIVEFSDGNPYRQNRQTNYEVLGRELARRTFEESGNYVIDQFILNVKSPTTFASEASKFNAVIDPGLAYINGYRVQTLYNYNLSMDKGTTQVTANAATISMNYGNYIRVKEMAGMFSFATGAIIELYATAKTFITSNDNAPGATVTAPSTKIGEARCRSLLLESGIPGTSSATYRLYLFDIQMNEGKNFANVRSVYWNDATYPSVADVVTETDSVTNNVVALLYDNNKTSLSFYSGADAVKSVANISYIYRTTNQSFSVNTAGIYETTALSDGTFPYPVTLSNSDKSEIVFIPLANTQASANLSGSFSVSGNVVTGTATSFINDLRVGDYIKMANSSANAVRQVTSIANNTSLTLANTVTSMSGNLLIFYPKNIPVSLDERVTATRNAAGTVLNINLNKALTATANIAIAYNVRANNAAYVAKTINRNLYVRLNLSNNAGLDSGPWCLGISDAARLRGVYLGPNNTFISSEGTDITNDFYIDHNQNENFYGTSYLFRKPRASTAITTSDFLLIKFDAFTTVGDGVRVANSYSINDTLQFANLSSSGNVNTLEIPEMFDTKGNYYDLRDQLDFRPVSSNTIALTNNPAAADTNPVEPSSSARFSGTDKKFPLPDSDLTCDVTYYVGRSDRIVVSGNGQIQDYRGTSGSYVAPQQPQDTLTISVLNIPPYPSLPFVLSDDMVKISDTKIANERYLAVRRQKYSVSTPTTPEQITEQQPRGYTMVDIAGLERRIRNLEFLMKLTRDEMALINRTIPSSVDPTINRFKFGFIVDTFSNYGYSDTSNPEYYASIDNGRLYPRREETNLQFEFNTANNTTLGATTGPALMFPFNEEVLIDRSVATDGPVIELSNTVTVSVITEAQQTIGEAIITNRNSLLADDGTITEFIEFKLSDRAGPAELYFNMDNYRCAVEIFYSATAGAAFSGTPRYTANNATAITTATQLSKAENIGGKLNDLGSLVAEVDGKASLIGSGKIVWTHNPNYGEYVKVRITKYSTPAPRTTRRWTYKFYFPSDSTESTALTGGGVNGFSYEGAVINTGTPQHMGVQYVYHFRSDQFGWAPQYTSYVSDDQVFLVSITGLKPSTKHTFVIDGVDKTLSCKQVGKDPAADLISGENGVLTFEYFYTTRDEEVSSDYELANRAAAGLTTTKVFVVASADDSSRAVGRIEIKPFVRAEINNTANTSIGPITYENESQISGLALAGPFNSHGFNQMLTY